MIVSEINIKLAILGQWGVGKTSIVNTFIGKDFPAMYIPTIGSNIARKEYNLSSNHIRLNIWDIGGQRSFNPLNPVFFSNLDSALLIFDLDNPKETLQELIQTYMKNLSQHSPECITYLIGNKSDLIKPEDSEILLNNIRQYQIEGFPIIFISAKTQDNISEAFTLVIFNFLKKIEKKSNQKEFTGISKKFLESINKNEGDLDYLVINLEEIDPNTLHNKITPTIIKKNVKLAEIKEFPLREIKDLTKAQEFDVNKSLIKENIIDAFKNNFSIISDLITNLKKAPIDSLINNIDKSLEDLANLKKDFELKLDSILELDSNKQQS
ncbi:MAG: GTP-binding protein [Candidatus Lokiarchaeota archaeon]|nr:GTP-binding protein [Candidatus Lokiarchaeota archaeon]